MMLIKLSNEARGFKASETLLGIETLAKSKSKLASLGFKASETLLGIETRGDYKPSLTSFNASKPLKPF